MANICETFSQKQSEFKKWAKKGYLAIRAPVVPRWWDRTIFTLVESLPASASILNLGSGITRIAGRSVNLDIVVRPGVDVIGDGHHLPFAANTFDGVFCNAVLEHVAAPWIVATEIKRILKIGGYAYIQTPFLEGIHDEADYYRFTLKGLRMLFPDLQEVAAGVSAGPSQTAADVVRQYGALFFKGSLLYIPARFLIDWLVVPLRRLDKLIDGKPEFLNIARGFYYVGQKQAEPAAIEAAHWSKC